MPLLIGNTEGKLTMDHRLAINVKDGTVLVRIPGGKYEIGDGKEANCPKHEVELSEYWLGVYCVSNRQYGRFVEETEHRVPDNSRWRDAEYLDHPVVNVSWEDAVAYAKWAGLELPSEAQWEVGARGPGGLIYPWGHEWDEKKCRNKKNHGNEKTCTVWGYGEGGSAWGTYQQCGNVWEWCGDWYDSDYYKQSGGAKDPRGPATGSRRVYRGGSWRREEAPYFRGAYRDWNVPSCRDDFRSFRLARNSP